MSSCREAGKSQLKALRRLLKYWSGSRVEAEGRMATCEGGASPKGAATTERRRQPRRLSGPTALLSRAGNGCVDFGAGRRCSLGRDRRGYRRCASRLGQRQNPQQRGPIPVFQQSPKVSNRNPVV